MNILNSQCSNVYIKRLSIRSIRKILTTILCTFSLAISQINAFESFVPDPAKLTHSASKSKDLYVESSFNFQTFNTYTLELNVYNSSGQPAPNIMVRVFSTEKEDYSDNLNEQPAKRSLLGLVKTDEYGSVYQTIEISKSVKHVLLELNSHSIGNQALVNLNHGEYISHDFAID